MEALLILLAPIVSVFGVLALYEYLAYRADRRKEELDALRYASIRNPQCFAFIERSRLGTVVFEVRNEVVRLWGRRALEVVDVEFELHSLSHRTEKLSRRFYRPILILFGLGVLLTAMTCGLVFQTRVPYGAVLHMAQITGIMAASFLIAGVRWLPRLEVARFKDVVGRTAFDIVKEKAYAAEFEEFVEQLEESVTASKRQQSA